jgi:signal transduction histidine kinase
MQPASPASARRLVVVMVGVVTSFVLATALSQWRDVAIRRRVMGIVGNAMPSVMYLAHARGDLQELDDALTREADERSRGVPPGPGEASAREYRKQLADDLKHYEALPMFTGEIALYGEVRTALRALDSAITHIAAIAPGPHAAAPALAEEHHRLLELDDALERLTDLNAEEGQRLGLAADRLRTQSMWLAFTLDAVCVILAGIATALAVRAFRRSVAALERSEYVAVKRASESEARAGELEKFAGRVAHDLKNPLHALELRLGLAERHMLPAAAESFTRAHQVIARMNLVIDGLLDFARSGAHPRSDARADVLPVIDDIVQTVHQTGAEAHITVDAPAPCAVAMSAGALSSVLSNLIRNAAKYVVEGTASEPRVDVRVHAAQGRVRVEVEDNGPGIPAEERAAIFELHVRGLSTKLPGSGIGLATVKRIVEAHGGAVGVESAPGIGSTFWVELPAAASPVPQARERA